MATQIEEDGLLILEHLVRARDAAEEAGNVDQISEFVSNEELAAATGLSALRLNDAVEFLDFNGYLKTLNYMGTNPYTFGQVSLTSLGHYEYQRAHLQEGAQPAATVQSLPRSPIPVGSPYGFTDHDWEFVEGQRSRKGVVRVVFGHQWESEFFDGEQIKTNISLGFEAAIAEFNQRPGHEEISLAFHPLSAGYGEHLFNEIARQIIAADIAVFETSDLNPNVMIEMGVALTWGIRVLPIKAQGRPTPPSDVSGQTWADYEHSGRRFVDAEHPEKLVNMIERVVRKKSAAG